MKEKTNQGIIIAIFLLFVLLVLNFVPACSDDDPDPTPTPTATATPTITPTFTPTGNAPSVEYPIDDIQVSDETILFNWSDVVGGHNYWLALWVLYPPGEGGQWLSVWNDIYLESDVSELAISKDEIWFTFQEEDYGWTAAQYRWSVTGDTSTAWSLPGYFYWVD